MLEVPYSVAVAGTSAAPGEEERWLRLPAAHLDVNAVLQPEMRRRGLFHAAVYTATVTLAGHFDLPPVDLQSLGAVRIDWKDAVLALGATNLRGLRTAARMDWNGGTIRLGTAQKQMACGMQILTVPLAFRGTGAAPTGVSAETAIPFQAVLTLLGSNAFHFVPYGQELALDITSTWKTPHFSGANLPLHTESGAGGLAGHWEINGDGQSALWQSVDGPVPHCGETGGPLDFDAQVGVALQEPVPTYQMISRASKYEVLFLTLSFLTLFLFEMVARIRIHLVQYGLLGISVSLFALLLISVAEPLGFSAGYAISTAAVLGQASLYTWAVVRKLRLAAIFAGVLGGLFAFLFVVLRQDSYALLAGTVALFAALSVVMFVTRHVDWSATQS
jgi:inner membrane protein